MRYLLYFILSVALAAQSAVEQRFTKDLNYLASPKLEGRGNGSKGLDAAANYVQKRYKELGLKVERQTYPYVAKVERASGSCTLGGKKLAFGKDIEALGSSGNGSFNGAQILFAGLGLNAADWDDFKEIAPKGMVVAISRRVPNIEALRGVARMDMELHARIRRIANLGAIAVLVLEEGQSPAKIRREEGPLTHPVPVLSLPMDKLGGPWGSDREMADSVANGPGAKMLPGMSMNLNVRMRQATAKLPNVTAILPGSDPVMSKDYIVVGAHMDHIGWGERNSRGGAGLVHPGADDNASGTAMVMELARQLKEARPKRSILLAHFSGEEEGLLGSAHWVQFPTVPIPSIKFMVNFDMVGRLDTANPMLHVGGLGATKAFLDRSHSLAPKDFGIGGDTGSSMGGSDHMSFSTVRIPSYFFFTGIHNEYHTPQDTVDRLNIPGMARIADYAAKVIQDLANAEDLPPFDQEAAQSAARRPPAGRRIAFGTVPDFSGGGDGFRISGATPGSTAEGIGLKAGDRITSFGDKQIADIYDFMEALNSFKGGDKIIVKWVRDGQEHQAEAILRER
jgi:hypothetical protein